MSVRKVLRMGDPLLLRVSEPVRDLQSEQLRQLLVDMRETMVVESGAGLAAPQIGVLLRVELELPSGLTVRARMTKEEYAHQGLEDGMEVSFQIRQYRVLAAEKSALPSETDFKYQTPPSLGENI